MGYVGQFPITDTVSLVFWAFCVSPTTQFSGFFHARMRFLYIAVYPAPALALTPVAHSCFFIPVFVFVMLRITGSVADGRGSVLCL